MSSDLGNAAFSDLWESFDNNDLSTFAEVDEFLADLPVLGSPTNRPVKKVCRAEDGDFLELSAKEKQQQVQKAAELEDDVWEWASLDTPGLELTTSKKLPPAISPGAGFAQPFWAEPLPRLAVSAVPPGGKRVTPIDDELAGGDSLLVDPPPGTNVAEVHLMDGGAALWSAGSETSPLSTTQNTAEVGLQGGRPMLAYGVAEADRLGVERSRPAESASVQASTSSTCRADASGEAQTPGSLSGSWSQAEVQGDGSMALAIVRSRSVGAGYGVANAGPGSAQRGSAVGTMGVEASNGNSLGGQGSKPINEAPSGEKRLRNLRQIVKGSSQLPSSPLQITASTKGQRPADLSNRLADVIHARLKGGVRRSEGRPGGIFPRLPSADSFLRRIVVAGTCKVGKLQPERVALKLANPQTDKALMRGRFQSSDAVLRSRLFELAEAVAVDDADRANFLTSLLKEEASPTGSPMQRTVVLFLAGLAARRKGMTAQEYLAPIPVNAQIMSSLEEIANQVPLLMFDMDVVNDAIQASVEGKDSVHILDLTMWAGLWGPLLRSLSERPGGPPYVRITAVEAPLGSPWGAGPSMPAAALKMEVMMAAAEAGVRCEYTAVTSRLEDLQASMLKLRPGEPLAVAACMRLQQLPDSTVVRSNPRDAFLKKVRSWDPKVFVICHFNIESNTPFFLSRVREAVDFYSTLFSSFEAMVGRESVARQVFEHVIWGREINHTVASEGLERIQREEKVDKWQVRMRRCGYVDLPFSNATLQSLDGNVKRCHLDFNIVRTGEALVLNWKDKAISSGHAWRA